MSVRVSLKIGTPSLDGELTEIFQGKGSWSMFRKEDEYYLVLNPSLAEGPECVACFQRDLAEVVVHCGAITMVEADGRRMVRSPFVYPLDQLVMMYLLAERQGAILHAAGAEVDGRGYIFPGRSGAGKSTLSRLLGEDGNVHLMSDDRIVVRKIEDTFEAFGTPWSGEAGIASNSNARLSGIFFISHASRDSIEQMGPGDALKRLLPVASIPWFDAETMMKVLSFCEDMLSSVPAYELSFRPGSEVVHVFEEFVSA